MPLSLFFRLADAHQWCAACSSLSAHLQRHTYIDEEAGFWKVTTWHASHRVQGALPAAQQGALVRLVLYQRQGAAQCAGAQCTRMPSHNLGRNGLACFTHDSNCLGFQARG